MRRKICQCYICVKAKLVQDARVQRELQNLVPHSRNEPDESFLAIKVLLSSLRFQPNWFEHLRIHSRCFTLICDGTCRGHLKISKR